MCDAPEFYRVVNRKARKKHKCCECSSTIEIGEIYRIDSLKEEGEICSFKSCLDCGSVRDWASRQPDEDCGVEFGALMAHCANSGYITFHGDRVKIGIDYLDEIQSIGNRLSLK